MRCTTLTQLPLVFCAGSSAKLAAAVPGQAGALLLLGRLAGLVVDEGGPGLHLELHLVGGLPEGPGGRLRPLRALLEQGLERDRATAERFFDDTWRAQVESQYGGPPTVAIYDTPVIVDNVLRSIRLLADDALRGQRDAARRERFSVRASPGRAGRHPRRRSRSRRPSRSPRRRAPPGCAPRCRCPRST